MLSTDEAFRLTRYSYEEIAHLARDIRDEAYGDVITYSPKVFIPLTHLCQDSCSYCTFAQSPAKAEKLYLTLEDVTSLCVEGKNKKCSEALFTLGEAPENRYGEAKSWLEEHGYSSTIEYLITAGQRALDSGLFPHMNAGAIDESSLQSLKKVSASQGMMIESIAGRLSEPGGPHFGSPDKTPARRLATLEAAGRSRVPFTTGILVGIGENRYERIEALLAIRDLHQRFGHIQEVIVQNFLPKENTGMASVPGCDEDEHLWSIAAARLIFGNSVHIQAPPNLASNVLNLIDSGIDDLGGISPVTIDHVNPERPWPELEKLADILLVKNKKLKARTVVYPEFIDKLGFIEEHILSEVKERVNASGYLKQSPLDEDEVIDIQESSSKRSSSNLPVKA